MVEVDLALVPQSQLRAAIATLMSAGRDSLLLSGELNNSWVPVSAGPLREMVGGSYPLRRLAYDACRLYADDPVGWECFRRVYNVVAALVEPEQRDVFLGARIGPKATPVTDLSEHQPTIAVMAGVTVEYCRYDGDFWPCDAVVEEGPR